MTQLGRRISGETKAPGKNRVIKEIVQEMDEDHNLKDVEEQDGSATQKQEGKGQTEVESQKLREVEEEKKESTRAPPKSNNDGLQIEELVVPNNSSPEKRSVAVNLRVSAARSGDRGFGFEQTEITGADGSKTQHKVSTPIKITGRSEHERIQPFDSGPVKLFVIFILKCYYKRSWIIPQLKRSDLTTLE